MTLVQHRGHIVFVLDSFPVLCYTLFGSNILEPGMTIVERAVAIKHFITTDGIEKWTANGFYHRVNGPAIIYPDGSEKWFFKGKMHRDGGPAMTEIGKSKQWFRHGVLHRIDGPAIEYADGRKVWMIDGIRIVSSKTFQFKTGCTDEELITLILKYGEITGWNSI